MNQSKSSIYNRQKKLLDYIQTNQNIRNSEASRFLGVSEITIRRDLMELEEQKLVERFHGGARYLNKPASHDLQFQEKEIKHEHEKNLLGEQAASLVKDGSTVFLNSGTTTLSTIKHLNGKHVRIITNNALAPTQICSEKIELILTGGECRTRSKSLIGNFAVSLINKVYADICILGVNGISGECGTTTSIFQETTINELMVKRCNGPIIVVADSSKIGRSFDFVSIGTGEIDILITDSNADPEELHKLEEKGIQIIVIPV